jgi:hypothetical protein
MLHIGHFSFDEIDATNQQRHGYFTCIIDAADPETAVAKFGEHILRMKKKAAAFKNMAAVYIEDIIRVAQVPQEPIITHSQSSEGAFPKSISHSLPGVVKDGIEAFGTPADVDRHEKGSGKNYQVSDPFIRFE